MDKVFLRTEFNYDMWQASEDSSLLCADPSKTVQSDAFDADINNIMARVVKTGQLPQAVRPPTYQDMPDNPSFREMLDVIKAGEDSFYDLNAGVRSRFGNDPIAFLEFCSDEKNLPAMREMGLAIPIPVVDTPVVVNP
ncbi:MAG: internal scaffolding protein [Microvirus sp.]|nr:MAG: internal scaffolding protein [Microvirus sp.]